MFIIPVVVAGAKRVIVRRTAWDESAMFYRVILNRHPTAALVFAVVLLSVSAVWVGYTIVTRPKKINKGPLQRYYLDVSTGELFVADAGLRPPIQRYLPDSPPTGVIAHVFACGSCDDESARFIGYIETFKPDAAARSASRADTPSRATKTRHLSWPPTHGRAATKPSGMYERGGDRGRGGEASAASAEPGASPTASPATQAEAGDADELPTKQTSPADNAASEDAAVALLEAARRIAAPSQTPVWVTPGSPEGVALRARVDAHCGASVMPRRCMPEQ